MQPLTNAPITPDNRPALRPTILRGPDRENADAYLYRVVPAVCVESEVFVEGIRRVVAEARAIDVMIDVQVNEVDGAMEGAIIAGHLVGVKDSYQIYRELQVGFMTVLTPWEVAPIGDARRRTVAGTVGTEIEVALVAHALDDTPIYAPVGMGGMRVPVGLSKMRNSDIEVLCRQVDRELEKDGWTLIDPIPEPEPAPKAAPAGSRQA